MKTKLIPLCIALVTCGLTAPAQDAKPAADASPPKPAATDASANATADPNEVVPLIVIDDVPLTTAIQNLARQANLNFQFDPRISGSNQPNVTIRFEKVTAQEALNAVLDNHNLALVKDAKSKIGRVTLKDPKAEDPLITRVIQLKYSDPTNLVAIVKPSLSTRSQVIADSRTSKLIIVTTEKEWDGLTNVIARLDNAPKQVLIEGRLLETAKNPSSVKGIDWSGTFEAQNFQFGNNTPDIQGGKPGTPAIPGDPGPPSVPGVPAVPAVQPIFGRNFDGAPRLAVNTLNGFYPPVGFLNADGVSATLSFLNKDSDTEVVATPRAVTMDNQTAHLSVTRAFPIFQVTPGSANSPAGATVTYTNLGTILDVTPRIAADNNISLHVQPEVSNIDSVDKQTLNGQVNTANIYAIRRTETQVMIPSGHTLVLAGLISDTVSKGWTKVPLLGDMPGPLGLLFRKESKNRNKANLIIFITPTILKDDDFQPTESNFLKHRIGEVPEENETAWDSGRPYDWTKPQRAK
jgi:type II secretory pathway component GspD/PulD (secretin)